MLKNQRKDTYQSPRQSSQKQRLMPPLLKVPPARRGNRAGAPFAVPLAKRGAIVNSARAIGIIPIAEP